MSEILAWLVEFVESESRATKAKLADALARLRAARRELELTRPAREEETMIETYCLGKNLEEIGLLEVCRRGLLRSGFNEKQAIEVIAVALVIHRRIETPQGGGLGGLFGVFGGPF